jgi:hypothetical protein
VTQEKGCENFWDFRKAKSSHGEAGISFMKTRRFFAVFLFVSVAFCADFSLDGDFNGIFDNLETKYSKEEDGTIFCTSTDLSFGFLPDENNTLLLGVHYYQNFGDENKSGEFQPLVSYKFANASNTFLFGTTKRCGFINYHDYVLSKHWQFENPIFEGIYFNQKFPSLEWSVWVDWTGLKSENTREMFLLGNDFTYSIKTNEQNSFNLGWQFLYNHRASRSHEFYYDPVEDIGAIAGIVAYKIENFYNPKLKFIEYAVREMLTYNRQREKTDNYYTTFGVETAANIDFKRIGLGYSQYFKITDNSPYYYNLETGDDKFRDNFGQLDINAHFLDNKYAKIDFTLSFVFINGGMDNRETMQVFVPIKKTWNNEKK